MTHSKVFQNCKAIACITAQTTSTTTKITSTNIPRVGFNSAIIVVTCNGASDTTNAVTLTPSMVDGATTSPATAVTLSNSDGSTTFGTLVSTIVVANQAQAIYFFDLSGMNANFKFAVTPSYGAGTPTVVVSAVCILCDAIIDPALGAGSGDVIYSHA